MSMMVILRKSTNWRGENMKGVPKRDGSGKGVRANRGRGGCSPTRSTGRGKGN